jgi:hypothetical protein
MPAARPVFSVAKTRPGPRAARPVQTSSVRISSHDILRMLLHHAIANIDRRYKNNIPIKASGVGL